MDDAEKLQEVFSPTDLRAMLEAMPTDLLVDALAERGFRAARPAGAAAIQPEVEVQGKFESEIEALLEPELFISSHDQLGIMGEFWTQLGYTVPKLSEVQRATLAGKLVTNPGRRVVPTPLLSFDEYAAVAECARQFSHSMLSRNGALKNANENDERSTAGVLPSEGRTAYAQLARNPQCMLYEGPSTFCLAYKLPGGGIGSRAQFITAMKAAGQTVTGEDGTVWVFPVTEPNFAQQGHDDQQLGDIHQAVNPTATTDVLLTVGLLHQANGTYDRVRDSIVANEAIYKLKGASRAELWGVVSVDWNFYTRQMTLSYKRAGWPSFGHDRASATTSGI